MARWQVDVLMWDVQQEPPTVIGVFKARASLFALFLLRLFALVDALARALSPSSPLRWRAPSDEIDEESNGGAGARKIGLEPEEVAILQDLFSGLDSDEEGRVATTTLMQAAVASARVFEMFQRPSYTNSTGAATPAKVIDEVSRINEHRAHISWAELLVLFGEVASPRDVAQLERSIASSDSEHERVAAD